MPLADVLEESLRIVMLGEAEGLRLRLLGGAAFALHRHRPVPEHLSRAYGDIDVAVEGRQERPTARLLSSIGYVADKRFNTLHGERRMLFRDIEHARKLDVFVGVFSMCHRLELNGHLPAEGPTLDTTDLLLTKLQIVEFNRKDTVDCLVLLRDHDVGETLVDEIHIGRVMSICGSDWGWFTTVSDNLRRLAVAAKADLDGRTSELVDQRLGRLAAAIETCPKSLAWRIRARVGRRLEWYDLPEEVG
jgi:hypothetical protein